MNRGARLPNPVKHSLAASGQIPVAATGMWVPCSAARGIGQRCRKSEIRNGCRYIKKKDIVRFNVRKYGCYRRRNITTPPPGYFGPPPGGPPRPPPGPPSVSTSQKLAALDHVAAFLTPGVLAKLVLTHPKIAYRIAHPQSMIWKRLWHNTWKMKGKRIDYKKACVKRLKRLNSKTKKQTKNSLEREKILAERKKAKDVFDKLPLLPPGARPTAAWSTAYWNWVIADKKVMHMHMTHGT